MGCTIKPVDPPGERWGGGTCAADGREAGGVGLAQDVREGLTQRSGSTGPSQCSVCQKWKRASLFLLVCSATIYAHPFLSHRCSWPGLPPKALPTLELLRLNVADILPAPWGQSSGLEGVSRALPDTQPHPCLHSRSPSGTTKCPRQLRATENHCATT